MSPLGIRLRELREAKGWTQTELSDRAEVRRATVIRIEKGPVKSIDLAVLEKLADALGVDPALLISRQRAGVSAPPLKRGRPTRKR